MTEQVYGSKITLNERGKEVIRIDEEGFHYNGQFIADAGEAHRLMVAFLKQNTAQPEKEVPTAWMYQGEPDFDGERWRENWQVTLDEKLARFKSGNKEPVPLWNRSAIEQTHPEPQGPTDEEILALSQWHEVSYTLTNGSVIYPLQEGTDMKDAVLSFTRAALARWGK